MRDRISLYLKGIVGLICLLLKNVWINCNPCLQINITEVQVTKFVKRGLGRAINR